MLKYKLIERGNPLKKDAPKKHYASLVPQGKKTFRDISKDIEDKSSLTRGDISNVLENLVDQIPKYLLDGQSVKLGDLGTFRLSLSCENKDDFNTSKIKSTKIIFSSGKFLKDNVDNVHFERIKN